jgi:hypothetical protein
VEGAQICSIGKRVFYYNMVAVGQNSAQHRGETSGVVSARGVDADSGGGGGVDSGGGGGRRDRRRGGRRRRVSRHLPRAQQQGGSRNMRPAGSYTDLARGQLGV